MPSLNIPHRHSPLAYTATQPDGVTVYDDPMLFEFEDNSDNKQHVFNTLSSALSSTSPFLQPTLPHYDSSPTGSFYDTNSGFFTPDGSNSSPGFGGDLFLSSWINDDPSANTSTTSLPSTSPSDPIPIPMSPSTYNNQEFVPYPDPSSHFPTYASPDVEYAALHPLPASEPESYGYSELDQHMFSRPRVESNSSLDSLSLSSYLPDPAPRVHVPEWTALFNGNTNPNSSMPSEKTVQSSPVTQSPAGPLTLPVLSQIQAQQQHQQPSPDVLTMDDSTLRPSQVPIPSRRVRRGSLSSAAQLFTGTPRSAPVPSVLAMSTRSYSTGSGRKVEETDLSSEEREATLRPGRRRKISAPDAPLSEDRDRENSPPLRSSLKPPKLAPSAWQLYFTDWIQHHQSSSSPPRKLNVAQAAKEAGLAYASLSAAEKAPYQARSAALKAEREALLQTYLRTLSPSDIKRENAYRAQQRKAGKSRKGNLRDVNAPKKPLSAYFMFLRWIREDEARTRRVFGGEMETTRQSVLAAGVWRSMTDEDRKPFLAQAEQEKIEYEAARKLYEEGPLALSSSPSGTTFNFSILPSAALPSSNSMSSTTNGTHVAQTLTESQSLGVSPAFSAMQVKMEHEGEVNDGGVNPLDLDLKLVEDERMWKA